MVLFGVVGLVVDLVDESGVSILNRSGDDDLPGAAFEVSCGAFPIRKDTGRLDDDVGAHLTPRNVGRIPFAEGLNLALPDTQDAVVRAHILRPHPVNGVALENTKLCLGRVSLIATISTSPFCIAALAASIPIRPKPFIPTRTLTIPPLGIVQRLPINSATLTPTPCSLGRT